MGKVKKESKLEQVPADVRRWLPFAKKYNAETGVPVELIMSIIWTESWGDPDAVGSSGERGLMQLKQIAADDVAENMEVDSSEYAIDPEMNIKTGTYLLKLLKQRAGNWPDAVKAFNQGLAGSKREKGKKLAEIYWAKVKPRINFFV